MGRAQRGAGERTRRWITLCTIPYFLFPISPADGADLLEIYRLAQSADTQYAAARASWAASQEKLPQGLSGLLPSASVGVTVARAACWITRAACWITWAASRITRARS